MKTSKLKIFTIFCFLLAAGLMLYVFKLNFYYGIPNIKMLGTGSMFIFFILMSIKVWKQKNS